MQWSHNGDNTSGTATGPYVQYTVAITGTVTGYSSSDSVPIRVSPGKSQAIAPLAYSERMKQAKMRMRGIPADYYKIGRPVDDSLETPAPPSRRRRLSTRMRTPHTHRRRPPERAE